MPSESRHPSITVVSTTSLLTATSFGNSGLASLYLMFRLEAPNPVVIKEHRTYRMIGKFRVSGPIIQNFLPSLSFSACTFALVLSGPREEAQS